MTNDIVALIDYYEKEKGIDRQKVIEALENAFITACRRMVPATEGTENLRADVNVRKGETRIFATLVAVPDEELTDKYNQVPLSVARKRDPEAEPGQEIEFVFRRIHESGGRPNYYWKGIPRPDPDTNPNRQLS